MSTDPAASYALFTGRFSEALAPVFADEVAPDAGERVLDVGCGPGALTAVLVDRLGAAAVSAVDPSAAYVAAARARLPGVDVRLGSAEDLPHGDDSVDVAVAALVVHFMSDPVAGLREMARVTRPGGRVAACVWDNAGGHGPLSPLWRAAQELDPHVRDESGAAGAGAGQLAELARRAGLADVRSSRLELTVSFSSFEEWWQPLALGVGSGGAFVQTLDEPRRADLRGRLEAALGPAPFRAPVAAWCVVAQVGRSAAQRAQEP